MSTTARFRSFLARALLLASLCAPALAHHASQVEIKDAWVRSTVPGQKGTAAFMKITTRENLRLVGASSPVAGVAEVHEMKHEGDVMRMRPLANGLELPAGKTVELKAGSYHLMLLDLKDTLVKERSVPLTLVFRDAKGVDHKLDLSLPVAASVVPGAHKH